MAILKDLIVHGSSRFLNKIYANEILTPLIEAEAGIIKKLKADDATVVGLLDVKGLLHTNSWSNSNIATIDGSFYITPTIGSTSGTVSITSSSLTFSGTNYAVSSLYLGDGSSITWPRYSKVLVTGLILSNGEWIPLGTLLGQLNSAATATSININSIKDNKNLTSNVLATLVSNGTTSSSYRNLKVSLYQRASSSTAFYPLGIYMTATGTNGRTFLDIYGGVESLSTNNNYGGFAEPNVRIGNLLGLPNVGGQTPSGWGIYTDNGYFKGIIAADQGYIGSGSKYWVIANYEDGSNPNNSRSYIYNNTDSMSSTAEGIYLGTDGIRNYKDSTHFVTIQNGVINAKGVNLTGLINATAGNIGGASITGGTLTVPAANVSGQLTAATIDASKISTGDISSDRITTNVLTALQAKLTSLNTNNLSAITANLGTITAGVIKHDTVGGTNGIWFSADTNTSSNVTIGNSTARKDWRLLVNNKFGVTKEGNLYASNVDLTGKITATSGTIGGILLDSNGKLWITDANISGEISGNHINASSISIGNLNGVSNYAQKTDVALAIDNIEVGGRNLLKNSNVVNTSLNDFAVGGTVTQTIPSGTVITLSVQIDADDVVWKSSGNRRIGIASSITKDGGGTQYIEAWAAMTGYTGIGVDKTFDTFFHGRVKSTYTLQGELLLDKVFTLYIQNITSGTISVSKPKLEIGNKATDWTPAPEDTLENINNVSTTANTALNQSVEYIKGTQTATTASWTGVTTESSLRDGKIIMYYLPYKGAANVTLNLTLADNTTTGAIPVYLNYSTSSNDSALTRVSTHYPAGSVIQMTYDGVANQWKTTGYNTNVNTNTIGTLGATKLKAGTNASNASATTVYRWTLIMKKTIGNNPTWVSLVTSSSNGTSKTRYTGGLYPDLIFYMSANYSSSPYGYNTGASTGDSYAALGFDLRYSTNCGSTLTIGKPVYLVGEINPLDGLFYLDPTWWTQTEPTTEDGKTYIYLGNAYSTTNIYLVEKNPLMRYYRGAFRTEEEIAGMTATSYITYINANDGIKVHNESDILNYLQLNSTAISMYRNRGDGINSDEVLRIDDSGIRIGKNEKAHFLLTNDKLAGYGDVGNVYFEVGKGDNTTIQLFYGNGERTGFEIGPLFKTIYYVKKNDITLTEGTDYEIDIVSTWYKIYFKTAPTLNSTISVTYKDFYKSFIYTIGSSSSGDITVTSLLRPDGTMTMITILTHKAYEAESIYRKKPGVDYWARLDLEGEQISGTYRYSFYLDDKISTGDQIRIDYSTEKHPDLTPDTVTGNYTWDATYLNSTLLTIRSAILILSVSVNNTVLTENQDYILDGLLKYGRLIFYNAPAVNEKIEMKFAPEEYNFEYLPTYFNFSNTNLENSVKGIGAASFGSENVNKGIFCFIEGSNNIVTGYASHVEGSNNVAAGSNSHVGGSNSLVLGQNTFAYGDNLQATYLNSAAFGYYNSPDNQLFSIGKGGYQNAFSINKDGNIQFGGRLLSGTTYEDKIPLFKIVEKVYTSHGVNGNAGFSRGRDITVTGYKPIAILGFSVTNMPGHPTSTEADASWCVIPRIWIGYDYTYDHQNYKTDSLYYYFWNLNTSKRVNVQIAVKILYIAKSAYPEFSQLEEEA